MGRVRVREEVDNAPQTLRFASCMAPIADRWAREVAAAVGRLTGFEILYVEGGTWEERERGFDEGALDVLWICGLPYVLKADAGHAEVLAAPVMRHRRYARTPVYFSDVYVRSDAMIRTWEDLRGARWAYNETRSHSGYNVVLHHLALLGERTGFFGCASEAGSHEQCLEWIAAGRVDAAAIDSTVFEMALARQPALATAFRRLGVLGPSPMPPWIARKGLPPSVVLTLRAAFAGLHADPESRSMLGAAGCSRFDAVSDAEYDPIRAAYAQAQGVQLVPCPSR